MKTFENIKLKVKFALNNKTFFNTETVYFLMIFFSISAEPKKTIGLSSGGFPITGNHEQHELNYTPAKAPTPTSTEQNVENVDPTKWRMYFLEELIGFGG